MKRLPKHQRQTCVTEWWEVRKSIQFQLRTGASKNETLQYIMREFRGHINPRVAILIIEKQYKSSKNTLRQPKINLNLTITLLKIIKELSSPLITMAEK